MTQITTISLFYPLIFLTIIVVAVTIGLVIKGLKSDNIFNNIFSKSSDNAKDVTIKITDDFKGIHHDVIEHALPPVYERELHSLEKNNKRIIDMLETINNKLNMLIEKTTLKDL